MTEMRKETDSLGVVEVPVDKLTGRSSNSMRSLRKHFSIGSMTLDFREIDHRLRHLRRKHCGQVYELLDILTLYLEGRIEADHSLRILIEFF